MDEIEIFNKLNAINTQQQFAFAFGRNSEHANAVAEHKIWLQNIRHEHPSTLTHFKIAVYIRYFNQTKYDDYIENHKQQFLDSLSLCLNWEFVGFYIDEGSTAPNMETAKEWSRLLLDCMSGKADLIITQKISNVSKKIHEVTLCSRILASQKQPIGIYFVSEDIYTLSSYYIKDLKDPLFLPSADWKLLPDNEIEQEVITND